MAKKGSNKAVVLADSVRQIRKIRLQAAGWYGCPDLSRAKIRRTSVAGIFPNEAFYIRLVTTYLMEYAEDWSVSRAYLSQESIEATLLIAA